MAPFTLEGRVLPSYAVPDGVPASERRCPTCPPYVVRCAHDPDPAHDGRVVWLADIAAWASIPCKFRRHTTGDFYEVMFGIPSGCVGGCGLLAMQYSTHWTTNLNREEADAAFDRLELVMLGRGSE